VLLLHGHSPKDASDLGYLHLSFTYPPAAALLFTPLAALPVQQAWAVMALASALRRGDHRGAGIGRRGN
jgi:alpha-1,2-mannosyltransferase